MSIQDIPFQYKKKIIQIIPTLQLQDFFLATQEQIRNSRGKRAISVQAAEFLLCIYYDYERASLPVTYILNKAWYSLTNVTFSCCLLYIEVYVNSIHERYLQLFGTY